MKENKKVLLGMSGGTDSSVAALLLLDAGYDVTGVTFRFYEKDNNTEYLDDARYLCEKLNIPHITYDLREKFKEYIIDYFIKEYMSGRTPVPCTLCNNYLKWPILREIADKEGIYHIATGHYVQKKFIKGYLHKEEKCNKVVIKETPFPGAGPIETSYEPLAGNGEMTLLRVHLITGRTHQIRSHLSYEGHPILGDPKYGDQEWNQFFYRKYGLRSQLLHAAWLKIPKIEGTLGYLSGRQFFAPLPKQFADILKKEHLEESIDNEDMARNLGIR